MIRSHFMRGAGVGILLALPLTTQAATDHSAHQGHSAAATATVPDGEGRDPHAYSGGFTLTSGPYALPGPRQLHLADEHTFAAVTVNRLEFVHTRSHDATAYDLQARWGRDYDRVLFRSEGEVVKGQMHDSRSELLWQHAIAPFWDGHVGLRYDKGSDHERTWLAAGVQGLAPYWFEVDATAYLGQNGQTAWRLGAEYDLLLTQKWIVQPRLELTAYGKTEADKGIGRGLSDAVAGVRVRYEMHRQFAPYVGVEWAGKFGQSADLARSAQQSTHETRWVAGVRFWF